MKYGIHLALGDVVPAAVVEAGQQAEALGFDFVSIFDHLQSANGLGGQHSLEAVAAHTLLADSTDRVQVGCLVYCSGYRHPGVLSKAISTIDAVSEGRAVLGLGAGWNGREYEAFGLEFLDPRPRLAQLEEYTQCVRRLISGEKLTFHGDHFQFVEAESQPVPVQERLPIWLGGLGEKHLIRIAATYGDGWNAPYVTPEVFEHKVSVLESHCADVGRNPSEIVTSVNLPLARDVSDLHEQFGKYAEKAKTVAVVLESSQLSNTIDAFEAAGCDQMNFALRSVPNASGHYDYDALALLSEQLKF